MTRFEKLVDDLTQEFIDNGGDITAEFNTSPSDLDEKRHILDHFSTILAKINASWVIYKCDTCGDGKYHCEIIHTHEDDLGEGEVDSDVVVA